jgi:hypothetical protein
MISLIAQPGTLSITIHLAGSPKRFLDAIEQTIERIKSNPTLYAIRHDDVRSIMVRRDAPTGQPRRFPHLIFYRVRATEITIVQIFPMKSDPRRVRG